MNLWFHGPPVRWDKMSGFEGYDAECAPGRCAASHHSLGAYSDTELACSSASERVQRLECH